METDVQKKKLSGKEFVENTFKLANIKLLKEEELKDRFPKAYEYLKIFEKDSNEDSRIVIPENTFSPEFLNRYDGIITFEFLNKESIRILAKKMIEKISLDIFKIYKVRIFVSEKTINFVSKKGFDSRFGARNLERTIRDEIEDKVSKLIFQDKAKPGETINL